ncbi:MAG: hypothetical protein JO327_06430 [Nitrososphaeraceae archaeon]|nr:hypothetical protein [Nitrososphaeraceae archaeon]MBV9667751.1 hypothetical protein [Nitrososphaeraceae archaeon]
MSTPIRNVVYEKIKQAGNITDSDLLNTLRKDDILLNESNFNKVLLDLEIYGLIRVTWITKDKRRIEVAEEMTSKPYYGDTVD